MNAELIDKFVSRRVVMDTQGPLIYIGRLVSASPHGYWLADADVHDRHDGHSTKEVYISQARELERQGIRNVNRRLVFVERHAIVSLSALDDVIGEQQLGDGEDAAGSPGPGWTP